MGDRRQSLAGAGLAAADRIRTGKALNLYFNAFSSREWVSNSLENAIG
jgi:hypothetical protein